MKRSRLVSLAVAGLTSAVAGYFGYQQAFPARAADVSPNEQLVAVRRGNLEAASTATGSLLLTRQANLTVDVTGGRVMVQDVMVEPGAYVEAGTLLVQLDTKLLDRNAQSARLGLSTAELNLRRTQSPFTSEDIRAAEAAVAAAVATLEEARMNKAITEKSDSAGAAMRQAWYEHNYYEVRAGAVLKEADGNTNNDEYKKALNDLYTAKDRLARAQSQVDLTLSRSQSEVDRAEEALRRARADLETRLAGANTDDVQLRRNEVERARLTVEDAMASRENAFVRAPFAGVVSAVNVRPGDQVAGSSVLVSLIDPGAVEVEASVDEVDVGRLKVGQVARLRLESLPNLALRGTIKHISPVGTVAQGVVSFKVRIQVDSPPEELRHGMTAVATVVVDRRTNVLLVPNRAVRTQGNQRAVEVALSPEGREQRRVRVGLADDQFTEVLDGLQEGDMVVVRSTTAGAQRVPGLTGGGPAGPGGPGFLIR